MSFQRYNRVAILVVAVWLTAVSVAPVLAQPVALDYLRYVRESFSGLREQMPHIIEVADSSASRLVNSEALVHISAHRNFTRELRGRAGGLGISTPGGSDASMHPDALFILGYAPNTESKDKNVVLASTIRNGYTIIFAAPEHLTGLSWRGTNTFRVEDYFSAIIDNQTGKRPQFEAGGRQISTSSLMNLVNGWVYVGELTASLTRLGKMPVFYLSFALDQRNDYVRAGKYSRELSPGLPYGPMKAFHDDVIISKDAEATDGLMVVPPLNPGHVGDEYLDLLDSYLADYSEDRLADLKKIVDRAVAVKRSGGAVFFTAIGHTFPTEVPVKERSRGVMHVIEQRWNTENYSGPRPHPDDLIIVFGMPTYPVARAKFATENGLNIIILSTEAPTDRGPESYETDRFLWLETPWPMEDGAIDIPGYDIKVLPVTGVMNVALYYAVRLELESRLGK